MLPTTPRVFALGESYAAIAEDSASIAWNPAGVSRVRRYTVEAAYADLFQWMQTHRLSAILPATRTFAFGFDWNREGFEDSELDFARDIVRLAYGFSPWEWLALGMNLKYLTLQLDTDGKSAGNATGWGTDWGLWWRPSEAWSVGAVAYNGLWFEDGAIGQGTRVRFDTTGTTEEILPAEYSLGVAFRPGDRWRFATEVNDRWHVGVEFQPAEIVSLQLGLQQDWRRARPLFSVGAQLDLDWFTLNYAYVDAPALERTSLFSISANLDFQPPSVEIERVKFRPLYPVLLHYYARPDASPPIRELDSYVPAIFSERDDARYYPLEPEDHIGRIWIRNLTNRPVSVKVVVSLERYISPQGTEAVALAHLEPHQRVSIPLRRLVFRREVLEVQKVQTLEPRVEVRDISDETRRRTHQTARLELHSRNQVRLDDIGQLAAFISPTEPTMRQFVNHFLRSQAEVIHASTLPRNLAVARFVLAAVRGISYAYEPNIPWERGAVDEVQFPQELLQELASSRHRAAAMGDCDDTTVLVCALLEAAHIPTALIQLPGHVLMAFDAGQISLEEAEARGMPSVYAAIDGYVWVPLETTRLKEGLGTAWQEGVRQIQDGVYDSITLREAWSRYPPVEIETPPLDFSPSIALAADPWLDEMLRYFEDKDGNHVKPYSE